MRTLLPCKDIQTFRMKNLMLVVVSSMFLVLSIPLLVDWQNVSPQTTASSKAEETQNATRITTIFELYSNLSCPFEWSKYSCSRHGRLRNAAAAKKYVQDQWKVPNGQENISARGDRRLLIVGDSTMRQIFIALGCRLWLQGRIKNYTVDWQQRWPCHNTPNCISSGPHSGFNVGSILLLNGEEIHFLPHSGTLEKEEKNIVQRWIRELQDDKSISFGPRLAFESSRQLTLSKKDALLYNVGLHDEGVEISERLKDPSHFGHILKESPSSTPTFIYMTTLTQHFNTTNGQYRGATKGSESCLPRIAVNPRRQAELEVFHEGINVDHIVDIMDEDLGELHIGGGDCTHYCMPGPPDVTTSRLLQLLQTI